MEREGETTARDSQAREIEEKEEKRVGWTEGSGGKGVLELEWWVGLYRVVQIKLKAEPVSASERKDDDAEEQQENEEGKSSSPTSC